MDKFIAKVLHDNSYSASFNEELNRSNLIGSRCLKCARLFVPPRPFCPNCHSDTMETVKMKGTGRIISYTVINYGLLNITFGELGKQRPYCCGLVELDEGVRITALITGVDADKPGSIACGTPVIAEFIPCGDAANKKTLLAFRKL